MDEIEEQFRTRRELAVKISDDRNLYEQVLGAYSHMLAALHRGKKILIFGNGGSAAEAQHFAAELVCRFAKQRQALAAIALTTDTSILTAVGNDLGFNHVFARQIEALTGSGDVVIGLTTSDARQDGHSANIELAFKTARAKGAVCIGFFSSKTDYLLDLVDVAVVAPSQSTALIQEVHQQIIHILCGLIEDELFVPKTRP